jgi:hypothetical protein
MNYELEREWNKIVEADFKVMFWNLVERAEENHDKCQSI